MNNKEQDIFKEIPEIAKEKEGIFSSLAKYIPIFKKEEEEFAAIDKKLQKTFLKGIEGIEREKLTRSTLINDLNAFSKEISLTNEEEKAIIRVKDGKAKVPHKFIIEILKSLQKHNKKLEPVVKKIEKMDNEEAERLHQAYEKLKEKKTKGIIEIDKNIVSVCHEYLSAISSQDRKIEEILKLLEGKTMPEILERANEIVNLLDDLAITYRKEKALYESLNNYENFKGVPEEKQVQQKKRKFPAKMLAIVIVIMVVAAGGGYFGLKKALGPPSTPSINDVAAVAEYIGKYIDGVSVKGYKDKDSEELVYVMADIHATTIHQIHNRVIKRLKNDFELGFVGLEGQREGEFTEERLNQNLEIIKTTGAQSHLAKVEAEMLGGQVQKIETAEDYIKAEPMLEFAKEGDGIVIYGLEVKDTREQMTRLEILSKTYKEYVSVFKSRIKIEGAIERTKSATKKFEATIAKKIERGYDVSEDEETLKEVNDNMEKLRINAANLKETQTRLKAVMDTQKEGLGPKYELPEYDERIGEETYYSAPFTKAITKYLEETRLDQRSAEGVGLLLKQMKESSSKQGAIIFGTAHAWQIALDLENRGISYIVIVPAGAVDEILDFSDSPDIPGKVRDELRSRVKKSVQDAISSLRKEDRSKESLELLTPEMKKLFEDLNEIEGEFSEEERFKSSFLSCEEVYLLPLKEEAMKKNVDISDILKGFYDQVEQIKKEKGFK